MKNISQLSKLILISALSITIIVGGCKKDDEIAAPELPPMESLLMVFSDFDTDKTTKAVSNYNNWGTAFANVSVWNVFISVRMAIPIASYAEALKQQPVYLGENKWEWQYDVTVGAVGYSAALVTERISNEEFTAAMYVTFSGLTPVEGFKWFEGTVRYDHTHALWTLYENPENPSPMIEIEWNRDWDADTGDITYTNVTNDEESGSFLSYSFDPALQYDASYIISLDAGLTLIEWNRETKAGRIQSQEKFGDLNWYCWNSDLQNDVCP
jgi:hypothetical protein